MRRLTPLFLVLATAVSASAQTMTGFEYYRLRQHADSLRRAADISGAEPVLRRLLAHEDRDGELWASLARSLETQNKRAEAISAYHKVLEMGFDYSANHLFSIARLYAQLGQRDSVIAYAKQALEARLVYRERLRNEPSFNAFKSDPEFRKIAGIPPEGMSRDQRWQFDLDHLVEESKRLHGAPERWAFRPQFDSAAAALRRDIPSLDDETIVTRMRELVVQLDDGHTGVYFENAMRAPASLYWFKDGVFVVRDVSTANEPATPGDTTLLGSRVTAVEGVPIDEALKRVAKFVARDNSMGVLAIAPAYSLYRPFLKVAGILRDTSAVTLTVQMRNGKSKTVRLPFQPMQSLTPRFNAPPPGDSLARPLFQRRRNAAYWMMPMREARAVYFQFNGVRNDPANPIPQFSKQLVQMLDTTNARALIVDLRHNGGGNSYLFPPFIRSMIVFKEKSPENQVYVITSRNTFSAAQNFATAIDQWVGAIFVGEPSGSRANFVGESSSFPLPATGTRVNISWRWHQYAQWVDHRKWLAPHIPAVQTSAEFFSGKDAALDAVLEVLRR